MGEYFKYRLYKDTQIPGIFISSNSKDLDFSDLEEGNYILEIKTINGDGVESNIITDYFTIKDKRDLFVIKNVYGQLIKFFYLDSKFQIMQPKDIIIYKGKARYFGESIKNNEINSISTLTDFFILQSGEKIFFELSNLDFGIAKITCIAFEGDKVGYIQYKKKDSAKGFIDLVEGSLLNLSEEYDWKVNYILKKAGE